MASVYLLTGSPGTGKTTVIKQAIAGSEIKAGGFYTEEIRSGGTRQGFRIVTLDGQDAILAHVDNPSRYRVSKYSVDIGNLDNIGVSAIERAIAESDLIVIDEIGKMELFSPRFREAVLKAIDSGKKVLGTIMLNPHPFADNVRRRTNVKVIELTRANHDQVLKEILDWLK
ncbi:MAG: NTPase [Dehalococcoidia bacterium]|jgi:nucleoside-triphosphatase